MIEFKNGKFNGGILLGQVHLGIDEATNDELWNTPLEDKCWVFSISKDSDIALFKAGDYALKHIPRKSDTENLFYSFFWNSELTLVFDNLTEAISQEGELKDLIFGAYLLYEEDRSNEEIMDRYMFIDDLAEVSNERFYDELTHFIISKNLSVESTLATMKSFILDCYRDEIVNRKLTNQNQ